MNSMRIANAHLNLTRIHRAIDHRLLVVPRYHWPSTIERVPRGREHRPSSIDDRAHDRALSMAAVEATEKLPDGSQMPKPWARLLGASLEPSKIGQDGVLLGETQILTYAGLFTVTVETDKLKAGGDDYYYLQAICRAPTASGEHCGLVQKLTRNGGADIEFSNTMDHLVAKHPVLVNIAHRSKLPKKGASASDQHRAQPQGERRAHGAGDEGQDARLPEHGGAGQAHRRHLRLGHRPSPRRHHRPSTDERSASSSTIDHRLHV
jgi:hypothetical protein